jgi:signal transduction histidine kinase
MNVKLRQFQNSISTVAALYMSEWVDLLKDFSENPFATVSDYLNSDFDRYDKRIQERANKVKEMIQKERASRAGQEKTVKDEKKIEEDKKAFDKSESDAARHELRLIDAQVQGKEEAEKMKADIEEKYRQRSLDREMEMAKRKADLIPQLQDLEAARAGPQAEMKLLEERARTAADLARKTGSLEDVTSAQKLALELQKTKESAFSSAGFGGLSASRARSATESIVGQLPSASQFRDIPSSTEAQRTQPVKLENPPDLKGIMDKLDTLIKNAGVFS